MPPKIPPGALAVAALILAAFLVVSGFHPNALPFIPGARFSDAVTSHLPAAGYLRHSLSAEEVFPIWREATFAGAPFAANPLNKTAYPLEWLAVLMPASLFLDGMIILHLLIAAWGMLRWATGLGMRRESALFVAVAYALSPRLIAHLGAGHLDIVYAMAWLPWVMCSMRSLMIPSQPTPILIRLTALATFAALMVTGDVRVGALGLFAAGVYGAAMLWQHRKQTLRAAGALIGAGGLFVILTAAVTVPVLLWSPYLSRAGLTQADAGVFAIEPLHLLGMVVPLQRANPETLTYVGLPVLILAIAAVTQFRRHRLWIFLALFLIVYAMGANGGLWTVLTSIVPGLLWFRVPSRAWIIVTMIVVLLAGYGLDHLLDQLQKRGVRSLTVPFLVVMAFTCADLFSSGRNWLEWRGGSDWIEPYTALAERLQNLRPDRIYQPAYSLPQQVAQQYYLSLFGGVDPFQVDGVARAIRRAGGIESDSYSIVQPPLIGAAGDDFSTANQGAHLDTSELVAWQVSHVIAPYDIQQDGLTLIDTVDGVRIYQVDGYHAEQAVERIPRWPERPDLPSESEVARLNAATMGAHVVSWIGFTSSGLIAAWAMLRQRVKS